MLLLDEPLGALDLKLREQMQEELKSLQKSLGITFVFVTHDQGEALSMADRIAVFSDGKIQQLGTPEEVYKRPQTRFVADFVGSSNVLSSRDLRGRSRASGEGTMRASGRKISASATAAAGPQTILPGTRDRPQASWGLTNRVTCRLTNGEKIIAAMLPAVHAPLPSPGRRRCTLSFLRARTCTLMDGRPMSALVTDTETILAGRTGPA